MLVSCVCAGCAGAPHMATTHLASDKVGPPRDAAFNRPLVRKAMGACS